MVYSAAALLAASPDGGGQGFRRWPLSSFLNLLSYLRVKRAGCVVIILMLPFIYSIMTWH